MARMVRHLLRLIVVVMVAGSVATLDAKAPRLQGHPDVTAAALQRFLSRNDEPQVPYRALRHLEAQNPKFKQKAWMDVWTEFDHLNGLRYRIVAEGGSQYIRTKVFLAALDGEQKMWTNREPQKASLTHDNYEFRTGTATADGLTAVSVKPRRKDVLLVEGSIFVQPEDGDLSRIEGKLSKAPSFWTRRVDIVRRYQRIAGERMPISIESVAHVLIAGRSTFKMTYDYETVNGQHIGTPQPPHPSTSAAPAH